MSHVEITTSVFGIEGVSITEPQQLSSGHTFQQIKINLGNGVKHSIALFFNEGDEKLALPEIAARLQEVGNGSENGSAGQADAGTDGAHANEPAEVGT